ncbi:MAG: hypothetical protein K5697_02475 [Lachnospiraceae bacterium]|nr:hypothetical protein [Lachnospiraceae bacterium]
MNAMDFLRIRQSLSELSVNHPKLFPFMRAVQAAGLAEGSVVEMKVTTPEGKELETNLRLTASDLELIRMLRELGGAAQDPQPEES